MARPKDTPLLTTALEEVVRPSSCVSPMPIDSSTRLGAEPRESLKKLSDSEVLSLALLQQLRGIESERSFLRDAGRFFAHLLPVN